MISKFIKKIHTKLNLKNLHPFSSKRYAKDYLSNAESFINSKNINSSSIYLIWVDTDHFKTNIFKKSKNSWTLYKSFLCTIGKRWEATIKGTFFVGVKGYSFGENRGFRCLYYTQSELLATYRSGSFLVNIQQYKFTQANKVVPTSI